MINNKILAFCSALIAIIILSSGCGNYFGPGLTNTVAQLESPAYHDKEVSANYASAQISNGNRFNANDKNFHGSLSYHRANTFKYGSLTYGAFGYLGNYEVGEPFDLPSFVGRKSYGGVGLMLGGGFHVPFRNVDFEILKFTTRVYNELGEYPQFKRELISVPREGGFKDLYTNHKAINDVVFGTGLKIKHENLSTTRISVGINTFLFGQSCSDEGNCYRGYSRSEGFNLQVGHSFAERVSLNFSLSSGLTGSDSWLYAETHPILAFGASYRF